MKPDMTPALRASGISAVGDIPWGTHFCHFYETKADLLDILIPYFKAGLESNELCIWVVCEPLAVEEATEALRAAVPGLDRHLAAGDMEILPHWQWYLQDGVFDLQRVATAWIDKLAEALERGYDGLRANGNETWLTKRDWKDFSAYEARLNELVARQRMIVLCTYPLAQTKAAELFDVARTHQFAIAKRQGRWEVLETSALAQAKTAIQKLNADLEQRVSDRTGELAAANEELKAEIAQRKRTEAVLRESEERYHSLFDNSLDAVLLTTPEGKILEANAEACRIFGYTQEEIYRLGREGLVDPADPRLPAALEERARSGRFRGELTFVRKGGASFPGEISSVLFRDSNGSLKTSMIVRDSSQRKRLEQEMAVIAEIGRVVGSTLDIDAVYERFAAEVRKLIPFDGVSVNLKNPGEETVTITYVSGVDVPDRRRGDTVPLAGTFTAVVMQTRRPLLYSAARGEAFARRYPGVPTEISVRAGVGANLVIPLFSRDNVIGTLHFRAMNPDAYGEQDIRLAERIAAQIAGAMANAQLFNELRWSEARFRDLLQNVPSVAVQSYGPDGTARYWNRASEQIYGYTAAEAIGRNLLDLIIPPEMRREVGLAVGQMAATGQPIPPAELSRRRKDGSPVAVFSSHAVVRRPGHEPELFCIDIDISGRKDLEERLQRAQKMEALGTLAGGVAHDLNNVLGIVVGFAEVLLEEIDESSPLRGDVLRIMEGGTRAAAIVQDLLTLARRGVQTRMVVNLNSVLGDYLKTPEFERLLSLNAHVRLNTDLDGDLLNIVGSPVHLGKTLFNLVSNAVEAMPEGGTVTIATSNRYVDRPIRGYDQIREGDYAVLAVADTGEGIAASDITRIFEPFYTKKIMGRSGTGLGLAVVWGTVKDHDGYIDVQSREGVGSTFTLYFPVARNGIAGDQVPAPLPDYLGQGESILVVDDVGGQRELAARMLTRLNYRVTAVASGEEAVEFLGRQKVDLLVLDMIMDPGIDGLETYRRILEINPQQKAVIVSGFSETDRVSQAQALGAGAYVRKPYVMERLGFAVRKELGR
jgi:PAS domain S-box-containing protein